MEFGRDGGHADLVGHTGSRPDITEYLVDRCTVDREFSMRTCSAHGNFSKPLPRKDGNSVHDNWLQTYSTSSLLRGWPAGAVRLRILDADGRKVPSGRKKRRRR